MNDFTMRHAEVIEGVIEGSDRLMFRGVLRSINYSHGLDRFLTAHGILLKDFGSFAERCTRMLNARAKEVAAKSNRPYVYLAEQLKREGIPFEQIHNALFAIGDLPRAQAILRRLETRNWSKLLNPLARRVNPLLKSLGLVGRFGYYWTVYESEYATDVVFKSREALPLWGHALRHFTSRDIQRLLFPIPAATPQEAVRRRGQVVRHVRLLRAHQLIRKVPHRNIYRIVPHGHVLMTTALIFRQTDWALLKDSAA